MLWLNLWSGLWRLEIENGDITHGKRRLAQEPSPNDPGIGDNHVATTAAHFQVDHAFSWIGNIQMELLLAKSKLELGRQIFFSQGAFIQIL